MKSLKLVKHLSLIRPLTKVPMIVLTMMKMIVSKSALSSIIPLSSLGLTFTHHFAMTAITIPARGGNTMGNTFSNMVLKAGRLSKKLFETC